MIFTASYNKKDWEHLRTKLSFNAAFTLFLYKLQLLNRDNFFTNTVSQCLETKITEKQDHRETARSETPHRNK